MKYDDIELLCPNGGRAAIDQYSKCNLGKVPAHVVRFLYEIFIIISYIKIILLMITFLIFNRQQFDRINSVYIFFINFFF